MTIREILKQVGLEFSVAATEPMAKHPLAEFIRNAAPTQLETVAQIGTSDLTFAGSAGKGNWAAVPWLAAFEKSVTNSATHGYYVVYLFNPGARSVALSINQGTTAVHQEFKSRYELILHERANIMRERLHDFSNLLPVTAIDVGSQAFLARGYTAGHAIGQIYQIDDLPSEQALIADFTNSLRAYRALRFRGGIDLVESTANCLQAGTVTERHQYGTHRRLERAGGVAAKVKKAQGYRCRGCDVNYNERYGEMGRACIEAHHLLPIHKIHEDVEVEYDLERDFAVLCANCHRLIHRLEDSSDIAELRRIVSEK